MFGFSPKLPVTEEERIWVDDGFKQLEKLLGRNRMLKAKVVVPAAEDFPDPYDKTTEAAERLFCRVCTYMDVDRSRVHFEVFPDETEELRAMLPAWSGGSGKCAAGLYIEGSKDPRLDEQPAEEQCSIVAIRSTQLQDPLALVATVAHELGHVILLGGDLIGRDTSDHEPMTDLLTVFLGLGIFNANSAARFKQFQEDRRIGWSIQRLGYLSEEVFAYSLAKFSFERGEGPVEWARHLSTNVRTYFKHSKRWLEKNSPPVPTVKPIT